MKWMSVDGFWLSTPVLSVRSPAELLQEDAGTPSVSLQVGHQKQMITWLRVFELPVTLGPPECAVTAGNTCRRKLSPGKLWSCGYHLLLLPVSAARRVGC